MLDVGDAEEGAVLGIVAGVGGYGDVLGGVSVVGGVFGGGFGGRGLLVGRVGGEWVEADEGGCEGRDWEGAEAVRDVRVRQLR